MICFASQLVADHTSILLNGAHVRNFVQVKNNSFISYNAQSLFKGDAHVQSTHAASTMYTICDI